MQHSHIASQCGQSSVAVVLASASWRPGGKRIAAGRTCQQVERWRICFPLVGGVPEHARPPLNMDMLATDKFGIVGFEGSPPDDDERSREMDSS